MRSPLVTLFCTLGLIASGGPGEWADDKAAVEKEFKKFHGTWTIESVEAGGNKLPAELFKEMTVIFEGNKYTVKMGDMVMQAATMKLDPSKSPKTFDSTVTEGPHNGTVILSIYEISGDTLKACFDPEGQTRPKEFKTVAGSPTLAVYKRVKK